MENNENPGQSSFWQSRYEKGITPWDLEEPAPPFAALLDGPDAPPPGRMIVPGCGRGRDALLFAAKGFRVLGIDFAPAAVEASVKRAALLNLSETAHFESRDIFGLLPEFSGAFDYVLEYTIFCAIPPEKRPEYVRLVHGLLKPGGKLIGTFFTNSGPGGPPFNTPEAELRRLFSPLFVIEKLEPALSVASRQGKESFGLFVPKEV